MSKQKIEKTNAARLLDKAGIPYELVPYTVDEENLAATHVAEELGDVLFAAVKVGRFAGIDPEEAVAGTCEKFIHRFRAVEDGAREQGRTLEDMPLEEMTRLWNQAK